MTRSAAVSCPESVNITKAQWEGMRKLGKAAAVVAMDLMFMANEVTGRVVTGTAAQTISALGCGPSTFYALVEAGLLKVRPRRDVYLVQPSGASVPNENVECTDSVQIATTTTTSFVSLSGREEEVQEKKGLALVPRKSLEHTEPVQAAPSAPVEPTPEMRKLAQEYLPLIAGATVDQVADAIARGTRFLPETFRTMLRWVVQSAASATVDKHTAGEIRTGNPLSYFKGVLWRKSDDKRGLRIMAGRVQEEDGAATQATGQTAPPSATRQAAPKSGRPVGPLKYSGVFLCYIDSRGAKFADKEGRQPFTKDSLYQRQESSDPRYGHIYQRFA